MSIHTVKSAFLVLAISWQSCAFATCLTSLQQQAPTERYTLNNATAIDTHTGLMWLRCPLGQQWGAAKNRCEQDTSQPLATTWGEAVTLAASAEAGGFDDWRLPNKSELSSLVDRACTGPAINEAVFPGTLNSGYWSSTPGRREEGYAWHVDFTTGIMLPREIEAEFGVYLVRSI